MIGISYATVQSQSSSWFQSHSCQTLTERMRVYIQYRCHERAPMEGSESDAPAYELDDVDRGVLYALQQDARNATAQKMAEAVGVSASTVRNRIANLEDAGVIEGYRPIVNYERAGYPIRMLFVAAVPTGRRSAAVADLLAVDGVLSVRELLPNRRSLLVEVAARDTRELRRLSERLADVGVDLVGADVVIDHRPQPFAPFEQ